MLCAVVNGQNDDGDGTVSFSNVVDFICFSTDSCASEIGAFETDFQTRQDPFTVCLLATDKGDDSIYKLVEVNVVTGEESHITEISYRNNCAMIYVAGML